jgi:hypothetical protein
MHIKILNLFWLGILLTFEGFSYENFYFMRSLALIGLLSGVFYGVLGQTTLTSGNWSDGSVWSGGTAPANTSGTCTGGSASLGTCTTPVYAGNFLTIDQDISISTGVYYFGNNGSFNTGTNVTDQTGGSSYTLTVSRGGGYSATQGILDIKSGTTTFGGAMSIDNANLYVRSGATLIIGSLTVGNNSNIVIDGTLIINGNFTNTNNGTGGVTISGFVQVNGNYTSSVGNVNVAGGGDLFTTGTIDQTGSSNLFGNTGDCTTGPCSGQNLCSFTNTVASSQVICSGSTPATLTCTTSATASGRTVQWYSSTTSNNTGMSAISGATSLTYSPGPLSQTTWFTTVVSKSGCNAKGVPLEITVATNPGGWIGTTNDWHTASNWCGSSIPTSSTDVTISPLLASLGRNLTLVFNPSGSINTAASVTLSGGSSVLNISGNLTNNSTITDNASSQINFVGSTNQTIGGSSLNTFNNITINNSTGITLSNNNLQVNGTLTMTQGNINLGGVTLQIGSSAASIGALSRAAGWMYNGNLTRYFNTTAVAIGNANGFFPLGISSDFRPFYIGHTGLTTGGYLKLSHTGSQNTSSSASFADGGSTVVKQSVSNWQLTTNSVAGAGTPFSLRAGGTSFGTVTDINHLRLTLAANVVGSAGTNSGSTTDFLVERTGLSVANLTNSFYVGSTNLASPLPVTLSDFTADLTKEGVALNWSTLTEENADYFDIEKSINGYDFVAIGRMSAHGSSQAKIDYAFMDLNTNFTKAYYRLKSVDFAIGNKLPYSEYSKVVSVEKLGFQNYGVVVYPNPVVDRTVTIKVGDGSPVEGQVMLCDLSGRTISDELRDNIQGKYQISETLQSGFYLLKVNTDNIRQTVKVIVK